MDWLNNIWFDIKRKTYDITGIGAPPIAYPTDEKKASELKKEAEKIPNVFQMAGSSLTGGISDLFNQFKGLIILFVIGMIFYYLIISKKSVTA